MDRKEQIINATLKLASKKGLSNVSMSLIAKEIGIQKPSLYNHFKSKEDLIMSMYCYLKNKTKEKLAINEIDYSNVIKNKNLKEILTFLVNNYYKISTQEEMLTFYKIIYSERTTNNEAANIMIEETNKMILATKNLFYALQACKKIFCKDIDMLATSFAMTIHSIIDYQMDSIVANINFDNNYLNNYIDWFCIQFGKE